MSTDGDGLLKALNDSQRYLDIVHKQELGKSEAEWLVETTVSNFANVLQQWIYRVSQVCR